MKKGVGGKAKSMACGTKPREGCSEMGGGGVHKCKHQLT